MIPDYHRLCRAAVAAAIEADRILATPPVGLKRLLRTVELDEFDGDRVSGPAAVCYFMNQPQPAGGSSGRDDWRFPVVVGLKSTGTMSGTQSGPHPSDFLGALADIFHWRKPLSIPSGVYKIEIDTQGATNTNEPKYQQLTAATTVVLTARLNRRR